MIKTPRIDALAASGMRFDNAYLAISSCRPSRCSIITGRYPHNTGAPELHSLLPDDQIRFPELVVHFPKLIKQGAATKSFVSTIDLSATCLELAGLEVPEVVQGQSFLPILKDPDATVREVIFSEQNWHVYRNHSRLVRWGDFAYIRNNYPNQINICAESDLTYPSGKEMWQAHAEGRTTNKHWQTFANPCPEEELYNVKEDPHQLTNLATRPEYAEQLETARKALARWTEETGDTIPTNPTPNRRHPPSIVDGKVVPGKQDAGGNPHAEFPGAAREATKINHPGPQRL